MLSPVVDDAARRPTCAPAYAEACISIMTRIPSISIVTPSLNQGAFLSEALLSVREQKYSELEHLVIDGGSGDDTIKILCRYSEEACWKHLRWTSEPDHGQSHALNKGFAKASGDIIGWPRL